MATTPSDHVPLDYSPATRLLYAAGLAEAEEFWDVEFIRNRVTELCADIRVVRRVVDEALELDWEHIVAWAPMTQTEKAWRTAHRASGLGDLAAVRRSLAQLPPGGYPTRLGLLTGHLGEIRRTIAAWRPVLDPLADFGNAEAKTLRSAAAGPWDHAIDAGLSLLPQEKRQSWARTRAELREGSRISAPTHANVPSWTAASLISRDSSAILDAELIHLGGLEPALLDDLIDTGRLTRSAPVDSLAGPVRSYLLARVDAARLSDREARQIGHFGELARRYFLNRDHALISGLDATPHVLRYQALLDVVDGRAPDPGRLDQQTISMLELPRRVAGMIKDGTSAMLPDSIARDPSLWPLFAELAIAGKLRQDVDRAPSDPLNTWIGLLRLLGLVWEQRFEEAVEHGKALLSNISDELCEDEVHSLTAYALHRLGRVNEALDLLEAALSGEYTEDLLVNVSIVAASARPEIGVRYLARLVDEAPTPELQRAGLSRAISVWQETEEPFPGVLVPALRTVLSGPLTPADYIVYGKVGVNVAADQVVTLPNPGGELDGPYRLIRAHARLNTEPQYFLGDLAAEYVAVYRQYGRPDWFNGEWEDWVRSNRETVFNDFGQPLGCAEFIDRVLLEAPELFTPEDAFVLAPQAGAHLTAHLTESGSWLDDRKLEQFFFAPASVFLSSRHTFNDSFAEFLADNFTRCISYSGWSLLSSGRDFLAAQYNPLGERLRWDQTNAHAVRSQMERLLIDTRQGPLAMLKTMIDVLRRLDSKDSGLRQWVRDLSANVEEWRDEVDRLQSNL